VAWQAAGQTGIPKVTPESGRTRQGYLAGATTLIRKKLATSRAVPYHMLILPVVVPLTVTL
jgi:hypothetical protein